MKRTWFQSQAYGELGIIESVSLRNFMCHDNLSFEFDPHMNFIVGRNGSGKSAILTGIILALGGKSGSTGRHANVKGFIKTGKHSATVSVTLKNCGSEAYRPNDYGEKITVERQFNLEGISYYKLKSASGQIVSTSKEELTSILNIMDIQIDNPITVLTQEISRNFLVSKHSKGHKLFKLFYDGTGLSKLEEDYRKAILAKDETEAEIQRKKSALPEMLKEIEQMKNFFNKSVKITELKKELMWAMVVDFEKEKDKAEEAFEKVQLEMSHITKNIDAYKSKYDKLCQAITDTQKDKNESSDKMHSVRNILQGLSSKTASLTSSVRELRGKYSRYEREVKKLTHDTLNFETMINDIISNNRNEESKDKLKHLDAINKLKQQNAQITSQITKLEEKKHYFISVSTDKLNKIDNLQAEIADIENSLQNVQRERGNLIAGMSNKIDVFGPEMKHLLQNIKRAFRDGVFKVEPKGPLGLYINVRNPNWSFAVQECLKIRFLKSFCCDNFSDADKLMKIIVKHYDSPQTMPSVIINSFASEIFDVSSYKTHADYPTVLDMLDIKDPVIANCLIDQMQIENILLIADQRAAVNLMMDNPPKNCKSAYTMNGDLICHSPYRFYSCRSINKMCVFKTVNKEDILKKEGELNSLNINMKEKIKTRDCLHEVLKESAEQERKIDSELKNLRFNLKLIEMKIKDEENSYEEPKDVNCLQSDLEQFQKVKKQNEEELLKCKKSIVEEQQEVTILETRIDEHKNDLKMELENFQSLSAKIDEFQSMKEEYKSTLDKLFSDKRTLKSNLEECEKDLKEKIDAVKITIKNAEDVSPRIDTKHSPNKIRQLIEETEKTVRKQQRNVDRETLESQYDEKIAQYNKAKSQLDDQERVNKQIDKMLVERFEEFQKICRNNIMSLNCCFVSLLKENNFSGYPDVNLEAKTLEIYIHSERMNPKFGDNKQNLAQLSGGERSYVTIAFLLALWDRIHMPFRILDEYDVFMDPNNRHLSINLLINDAKSKKNVQYIFLSPLELPPMANSSHVKVHKMPAPKR